MRGISVWSTRLLAISLLTLFSCTALLAGPTITSISPGYGSVGTNVTLSGSGFGATQGTSTVQFGTYGRVAGPNSRTRYVAIFTFLPYQVRRRVPRPRSVRAGLGVDFSSLRSSLKTEQDQSQPVLVLLSYKNSNCSTANPSDVPPIHESPDSRACNSISLSPFPPGRH